jgi:hypothetical protein
VNFKTTLLLLLLLLGAAGVYLITRSGGSAPATPPAPPPTLLDGRDFSRIQIDSGSGPTVLELETHGWWQTDPVRHPADRERVEALINAGLSLSPRRQIEPEGESGSEVQGKTNHDHGGGLDLDPPLATVTFTHAGVETVLQLGRTTLVGTGYLRTNESDEVFLVDDRLHRLVFESRPRDFWSDTLPTLEPGRINQLTLDRDGPTADLRRTADGWVLQTAAGGERADEAVAVGLLDLWSQLQPVRFVGPLGDEPQRYGLDDPAAEISVEDAVGRRQTLRLGRPADLDQSTRYATWTDRDDTEPVVFTVPSAFLAAARVELDQLRDRRLVTALPESIRGQQANRVGRDVVELMESDGGGIAFVQPTPNYMPDPELARDWLLRLTRVEPMGFAAAPREAQAPLAVVQLQLAGGRAERVRLYADRDGRDDALLVVRESEPTAAIVPQQELAPLLEPVITLRNRQLPPPAELLDTVRLVYDDGQALRFRRGERAWELEEYLDAVWERRDFRQLVEWLEAPRVEAWTARPELPRGPVVRLSTGPDRPAYIVNVQQNLAQRTDLPGVFRLPDEIATRFAAEYRPRLIVPYRVDQIAAVRWSRVGPAAGDESNDAPASAHRLTRDGAGGMRLNGQPVADPAAAAAWLQQLAGLRAKRFPPPPAGPPEGGGVLIEIEPREGPALELERFDNGLYRHGERYFFIDAAVDATLVEGLPSS